MWDTIMHDICRWYSVGRLVGESFEEVNGRPEKERERFEV